MKSVDILVAVRNEEKSIPLFVNEINKDLLNDIKINIIFLEDGSKDCTVSVLQELSKKFDNVKYISLDNKFGQYSALTFGLSISKADAVITMDVDGGHPIETAFEMIKVFLNGYNLVQGHRIIYKRKKIYRSILSYAYNFFFYLIVGVNFFKQNVMFRLMDKSAKEKFLGHKNWWHIFKTNFNARDQIVLKYIEYTAPEREIGKSKYGFLRLLKLSYKSFFSMMAIPRFITINFLLVGFIIICINYELILISIFSLLVLLIFDISYYLIINQYPIPSMKIKETSISGLK
jgi:glycosyltransferase involved in cell wall biosynthesis